MAQYTFRRDSWVKRLKNFLADHNYSRHAIKNYSGIARRFLNYLEGRQVSIDSVHAALVDAYLRSELDRYRRKHGHTPDNMQDWRWHLLTPIHKLLTLAQGAWPPVSEVETQVRWFEGELKAEDHGPSTVGTYIRISRGFLKHLHKAGVDLKDAEPAHVLSFIDYELRRYQQRHQRLPLRLVNWRCGLTSPIHMLLRKVRGIWPPLESLHQHIKKLEEQLRNDRFSACALARHLHRARHFLGYLETRGIAIEQVCPSDVRLYCRTQLATYSEKHGRQPLNHRRWTVGITSPVNRLLRLVLGCWPPGSGPDPAIEQFRQHLAAQGFSATVIPHQVSEVRCFFRYLKEHKIPVASVQPEHVSRYLKARLALYRRSNGQLPPKPRDWRYGQTGPIHRLLRLLHGQWPPAQAAGSELESLRRNLLSAYVSWMADLRGLSQPTVRKNRDAARIFLEWLTTPSRSLKQWRGCWKNVTRSR